MSSGPEDVEHSALPCGGSPGSCSLPPIRAPPPPTASFTPPQGRARSSNAFLITGSFVGFALVFLAVFLFVRRRRRRRRQQQEALLEAAMAPAALADGGAGDIGPAEEVVHHAWHIRTVGLDEAAIESIALMQYRAGAGGVLGAADCAVCLGEFRDGDLLRLLPKCAHAFHVQCIDTWLRAHVNCPLCRAGVLDPAGAGAEHLHSPPGADQSPTTTTTSSIGATEPEQLDQQANHAQFDQRNDQPRSTPELPHHHRPAGPQRCNFRRVASMDSPPPMASVEDAPDDDLAGGDKQGSSDAASGEASVSPGSSSRRLLSPRGMARSFSAGSRWALASRHRRARSSLLPL